MRRESKRKHLGESKRAERPSWMWARKGHVTLVGLPVGGIPKQGVPVFMCYEDAKAFISSDMWDRGVRPAKIGSVAVDGRRETLEDILISHHAAGDAEFMAVGRRLNGTQGWEIFVIGSDGQ